MSCFGRVVLVALLFSRNLSVASPAAPVGLWHAELIPSAGHEVFFDLKIATKGAGLSAVLVNDRAEFAFTSASWDGTKLTLDLANYDARIVAEMRGGRLEGGYTRVVAAGLAEVPFRASRKARPLVARPKGGASLDGSWGVEMIDGKKTEKLTGVFRQKGSAVTGTFLDDRRLRLSPRHLRRRAARSDGLRRCPRLPFRRRAAAGRHARGRVSVAHESARVLARKAAGPGLSGDVSAGFFRHREGAESGRALRRLVPRRPGPHRVDLGCAIFREADARGVHGHVVPELRRQRRRFSGSSTRSTGRGASR